MDTGRHHSVVQRGLHEAVVCQDMLERVPVPPSRLDRLRGHLAALVRAVARPGPTPILQPPPASLELTR